MGYFERKRGGRSSASIPKSEDLPIHYKTPME